MEDQASLSFGMEAPWRRSVAKYLVVILGICLTLILWVAEAVVNAFFFERGSFWAELFSTESHDVALRSLAVMGLVAMIAAGHTIYTRLLSVNERLRQARVSLQESESLYRSVLDLSPDAIVAIRPEDWCIAMTNQHALSLHGFGEGENLTGRPAACLLAPEDGPKLVQAGQRAVQGEIVRDIECQLQKKDGSRLFGEISLACIRDAKGAAKFIVGIARDVTQRKLAEASIRESEDLYRSLMETIPDAVVVSSAGSNLIMLNQQAISLFRVQNAKVLIGESFLQLIAPEMREATLARMSVLSEGGAFQGVEAVLVRQDGSKFPAEVSCSMVKHEDGRPRALVAVVRDVEARKRMEQALREREALYRTLVEMSPEAIALFDFQYNYRMVNERLVRLFGYDTKAELLGRNARECVAPEFLDRVDEGQKLVMEMDLRERIEYVFLKKDGQRFPAEISVALVRDDLGAPIAIMGVARDLSERKRMELEMLQIRDQEQKRIGQDLHDSACSQLAGVAFLAENLERGLRQAERPEAGDVRHMKENIRSVIAELRSMAQGLSPVPFRPDGLMMALEDLAMDSETRLGITCIWECEKPVMVSDNAVCIHLYRIAQEAISNAVRHGRAETLMLRLESKGGRGALSIEDDGCGMPEGAPSRTGRGLNIMRHRASLIDGSVTIRRLDPTGTAIVCAFPLERQAL